MTSFNNCNATPSRTQSLYAPSWSSPLRNIQDATLPVMATPSRTPGDKRPQQLSSPSTFASPSSSSTPYRVPQSPSAALHHASRTRMFVNAATGVSPRAPGAFSPPSRTQRPTRPSPGGAVSLGEPNTSAQLARQRFRERCQSAMARERNRALSKARSSGGYMLSPGGSSKGKSSGSMAFKSDELSGSGSDEDDTMQEEIDEDMLRMQMITEYKRMQRSGVHALGWLGADEVAWLEEELKRSESSGMEPPDDIEDDETLAALWEHANAQSTSPLPQSQESQQSQQSLGDDMDSQEQAWWNEVAASQLDVLEAGMSQQGDGDAEMELL